MQLLQEELNGQQPVYEQFIQAGHSVLDKCEPASKDSVQISQRMDSISKAWERLQSRLTERQENLSSMTDLSANFQDILGRLQPNLTNFVEKIDTLNPVIVCSNKQKESLDELKVKFFVACSFYTASYTIVYNNKNVLSILRKQFKF